MPKQLSLHCRDGYPLAAQIWLPPGQARGSVIVSSATGVLARYYARYAGFLRERGYAVLTYDYRGIGGSRPASLRKATIRWRDWGDLDFDAAVRWMRQRDPDGPLVAVGHSIGGFLPGFAESATEVDRFLSVGAQYAYWRDYAAAQRWQMFAKWHLFMPAVTALCGYFPGRRLGWLEDLPAGVAREWAFRSRFRVAPFEYWPGYFRYTKMSSASEIPNFQHSKCPKFKISKIQNPKSKIPNVQNSRFSNFQIRAPKIQISGFPNF